MAPMTSPKRQLALQGASALLVLALAYPYYGMRSEAMPWAEVSFAIGFIAFLVACFTRQPIWWRFLHALFAPLVWTVSQYNIDPGWFLLAFILLLLVYRGALTEQVPLYLSNTETVTGLEELLADRTSFRFIDLGSGIATTVLPLARRFPASHFTGVENAPLTWLVGRWRTRNQPNLKWCWGSFWDSGLKEIDVAYAFLSPAPMEDLWQKVLAEMPPGSLFISNSFPVPEVEPLQVIAIDCQPARSLYCYQLPLS